jgi:hypothetical protein
MNLKARAVTVPAGTGLGRLSPVNTLNKSPTEEHTNTPINQPNQETEDIIVPKLMAGLPSELTAEQRHTAEQLFRKYEDVFSKSEFDVGHTPLIECRINTGDHRPIRQTLRRQPLKHMDTIDQHVNEML